MHTAAVDVKIPDPSMYDNYEPEVQKESSWVPPPCPIGEDGKFLTFQVTVPSAEHLKFTTKEGEPLTDKHGYWMCVIEGLEVQTDKGPYTLGWTYLSSAPFNKYDKQRNVIGKQNRSTLGNFFRACGLQVRPTSAEEYEQFVLATAGATFLAQLDWSVWDADAKKALVNTYRDMPDDDAVPGRKALFVGEGDAKKWARCGIKRYIDAVG